MSFSGLIIQLLNGMAGASSLFLVSAGLSLIFGVTRIVNFAHGSFFMLGIYLAYTLIEHLGRSWGLAWSIWPFPGRRQSPARTGNRRPNSRQDTCQGRACRSAR